MDRRDGLWSLTGKPGRHASPEVAAVRDEPVISESYGHQLMPEPCDLASRHARGRRWPAEPVPGQRGNDDRERVGGVCAVCAWVRQERKD